jgi:hypothetical protein
MASEAVIHPIDVHTLSKGKFRGPVRFYDGRKGMAQQDFESGDEPRFGYAWRREHSQDKGRTFYMVDGKEVADLEEAARLLASPPDPESPAEQMRREFEDRGPAVNGCYNAKAEARCNADVGAFAMVRASLQRVGNPWHNGINRYSEEERAAGREFPHMLYNAMSSAHEAYRLMYLWKRDRKADTHLECRLGVKCRECPILRNVEQACVDRRDAERLGTPDLSDDDIDMAKTWTCITHMLQETPGGYLSEGMVTSADDREDAEHDAARWAAAT